jgi:hypothetical protein
LLDIQGSIYIIKKQKQKQKQTKQNKTKQKKNKKKTKKKQKKKFLYEPKLKKAIKNTDYSRMSCTTRVIMGQIKQNDMNSWKYVILCRAQPRASAKKVLQP